MNKVRIIGLVLVVVGVTTMYNVENSVISLIAGFLGGAGIAFLISGRVGNSKK